MQTLGHLMIEDVKLPPGQEWVGGRDEWWFLLISAGAAYWLDNARNRSLAPGEMLILPPAVKGIVHDQSGRKSPGRQHFRAFGLDASELCFRLMGRIAG